MLKIFLFNISSGKFWASIVEALSHGIPVLITNKVNIWREIKNYRRFKFVMIILIDYKKLK